ncbi:hypothetical protein [Shewanella sp. Iso12]|uniref:hypothetical protein n=1 Tax=Shewanella sp. Iso12 TaxID=1826753 RepID=UPI00142F48B6|nr:hypothetical protein [Shewanella sp. Iso12]NJI86921.1 hypothetical protein [Shewanella sp. Iso12]
MKITVREMAETYFNGDRNSAAKAAGVTLQFFNNWVSQGREVMRLDNGDFVLVTKNTKIIKKP